MVYRVNRAGLDSGFFDEDNPLVPNSDVEAYPGYTRQVMHWMFRYGQLFLLSNRIKAP